MTNFFARQGAAFNNQVKQSTAALCGIAQGLLADGKLTDEEIRFLNDWLENNDVISTVFPGDVLFCRVQKVLADGMVTREEREHLVSTLQSIVGGTPEDLANRAHTCELALDDVDDMIFRDHSFCFSGEFAFGPRSRCVEVVEERGGLFFKHVTKKLNYLVAGGLGSDEWKHGSFGTKIEKGVRYRRQGLPLLIVHEADWARHL